MPVVQAVQHATIACNQLKLNDRGTFMSIFDTIWRRRGRPFWQADDSEEELPVPKLTMTDRDYSDLLEHGDVAIKFWLPEIMGSVTLSCNLRKTTAKAFIIIDDLPSELKYATYPPTG